MIKDRIFKTFLFILFSLSVSLTGCAQVKYVMNWFYSPGSGHDSPEAVPETSTSLSDKEVDNAYRMACYLQERKQYNLSINEFQKVISNRPGYARAYNGMGVSYDLMGDYKNAVQSYKKAMALDPGLDYVHNNIAYCYSLQGLTDEAIDEYKKAIELNPAARKYHNNLGKAYAMKGKYDLAMAEFMKTTDEAGARSLLAEGLYKSGSYKEAAAQLAEASKLAPNDTEIKKGMKASSNMAKINQEDKPLIMEHKAAMQPETPDAPTKDSNMEQVQVPGPPVVRVKIASDEPATEIKAPVASSPVNQSYAPAPVINQPSVQKKETGESSLVKGITGMVIELISDFPDHPMVKKIRDRLIKLGFAVEQTKNTGKYGRAESKLYYFSEHLQEAYQAAKQVPGYQNMYKLQSGYDRKIQVVIGNDLVSVKQAASGTTDRLGG
jgi:tetratricopeptide (TPR) repeat protein